MKTTGRVCDFEMRQLQNGSEATDWKLRSDLREFNRSLRSRSVVEYFQAH
jgi:hypothetical protein